MEARVTVVAAGFVLQINDPGLPDRWDMLKPEPTVKAYRQFARRRTAAVSHALARTPRRACATICAGAVGAARTPIACRSSTSSI
jgi:hypothetical protein